MARASRGTRRGPAERPDGVAGTGAYNWKVLKPVLGTEEGARRITRSSLVELGLGTLLLLVTAVLVQQPMPGDE